MVNVKFVTHILLLVLTVLYIITGLGVTYYRIAEQLTFGLLSKALASQVHELLIYPFVPVLVLHIYFSVKKK